MVVNVGGKPKNQMANKTESNKLVLFTCLLTGTVMWIGYRASLTSELSAKKIQYPFNSIEELYETDFVLATDNKGSTIAELIRSSKEGAYFHKVLTNHMMTNDSFVGLVQGLQNTVGKHHHAYFEDKLIVQSHTEYSCKVSSFGFYTTI